jgi:octaprenyl-diphosphate synthase
MLTAGQNKMVIETSSVFNCALIADELAGVSKFFNTQLNCPDVRLKPFIDYLKNRQGKMLRASFVLLCGRLFGSATPLHIKVAAITEMIHAATLLHDDVIDGGTKRRYHATANNLWGTNLAVLLGDFLLSRAFVAAASLQRDNINQLLIDTATKICRGEMLQNACRGDCSVSVDEYLDIIGKKTAVFFADCCRLGAIISKADAQSCDRLYEFGLNFGLSYQIIDDLTDILGAESRTGKTGGRDFDSKTLTMPVIHALKTLSSVQKNELLESLNSESPDIKRITSILHAAKSLDFTKSQAEQYRQKAFLILEPFGCRPAAAELKELVCSATKLPL